MNFFLEWQERTNSEELNMDSIMKNYHIITKENDEIVAGDINSQLENLNYKLEKRSFVIFFY